MLMRVGQSFSTNLQISLDSNIFSLQNFISAIVSDEILKARNSHNETNNLVRKPYTLYKSRNQSKLLNDSLRYNLNSSHKITHLGESKRKDSYLRGFIVEDLYISDILSSFPRKFGYSDDIAVGSRDTAQTTIPKSSKIS